MIKTLIAIALVLYVLYEIGAVLELSDEWMEGEG